MKNILLISFLLIIVDYANAQQVNENIKLEPLITDRPDATESPNTIHVKMIQFETGSNYSSVNTYKGSIESLVYNTSLLRIGILENLELRIGYDLINEKNYYSYISMKNSKSENYSNSLSGISPMLFGVKISIQDESENKPAIGFLGHLYLPFTASEYFKPKTTGADFRFSFGHTLNNSKSITYNLGAQWREDKASVAYVYTIAYGLSFSEKWGSFIEIYGDFPENKSSNHFWDGGLTYLLNNDFQLDTSIGSGLSNNQKIYLSIGFSYRFKTHFFD